MRAPFAGRLVMTSLLFVAVALAGSSMHALAQDTEDGPREASDARRITITWTDAPIREVLLAFSVFSGRSIVAGSGVSGTVTAKINDQPWDVALQVILTSRGLIGVENEHGIIEIDDMRSVNDREAVEPIVTRAYRVSFVPVSEIEASIAPLLSERGSISVSPGTNTVVVSDIARVHRAIAGAVRN